jgi:hypothetical protein
MVTKTGVTKKPIMELAIIARVTSPNGVRPEGADHQWRKIPVEPPPLLDRQHCDAAKDRARDLRYAAGAARNVHRKVQDGGGPRPPWEFPGTVVRCRFGGALRVQLLLDAAREDESKQ